MNIPSCCEEPGYQYPTRTRLDQPELIETKLLKQTLIDLNRPVFNNPTTTQLIKATSSVLNY